MSRRSSQTSSRRSSATSQSSATSGTSAGSSHTSTSAPSLDHSQVSDFAGQGESQATLLDKAAPIDFSSEKLDGEKRASVFSVRHEPPHKGDGDNASIRSHKSQKSGVYAHKPTPEERRVKSMGVTAAAEISARVEENRRRLKEGKEIKKGNDDLRKEIEMDEHTIAIEDLFARCNVDPASGLTSARIPSLLVTYGPNALTPPKERPVWLKLLICLTGDFAILLWIGAGACFVAFIIDTARGRSSVDNLALTCVLVFVIVASGLFTFYQNQKSDSAMKAFAKMAPSMTRVLRDGELKTIDAIDLVPGDIVHVKYGDKIPADIRIIETHALKVDNSSLTGESDALSRDTRCTHDNPLETKNLAFYSTSAVEGSGIGIVVSTGDNTVIGRIASLVNQAKEKPSSINREISHFVHIISAAAMLIGGTFFIVSQVLGYTFLESLIFFIGITTANVPEGLLVTVTAALTLTVNRMAVKNVLIKKMDCVETLGSTTCICSDKTGTLTQNRMTTSHCWYGLKMRDASLNEASPYEANDPDFIELRTCATLCNRTNFVKPNPSIAVQQWDTDGDASESALVKFTQTIRDIEQHRQACPELAVIPFNSSNKYAVSIRLNDAGTQAIVWMKGAPERILERSSHLLVNGKPRELDDECRKGYDDAYLYMGKRGERVLGFAYLPLDPVEYPPGKFEFDTDNANFPLENLTFLGLFSLIDPPRDTVPAAVAACQLAGVRIVMVTGDHPITAKSIAQKIGIIKGKTVEDIAEEANVPVQNLTPAQREMVSAIVVPGSVLKDLSEEELDSINKNYNEIVFARTSPQQKLIIVESCQRVGHVVAVTGDGVNDSPALKAADIGIAMGIAGTEVSKEAANIILMDDDFSSIVKGVEEGRLIFDNLKKSIAYTLTSNVPEVSPFIAFCVFSIPLPLTTIMILCIDLGTDMLPAISYAYEEAESDIMLKKPRDSKYDRLVTSRLISFCYLQIGIFQIASGFFAYFVVMGNYGFRPSSLFGLRADYDNEDVAFIKDSYGQEWDYDSRQTMLNHAQSAYLFSIFTTQWGDLISTKTRSLSILHQGARNSVMNFSVVFSLVLMILMLYIPGAHIPLKTRPLKFVHLLPGFPFSFIILFYDELRKLFIRQSTIDQPNWARTEFYY